MNMTSLEDHKSDAEELKNLISMSKRTRVKEVLQRELINVEQEMSLLVHDEASHQPQPEQKPSESESACAEPSKTKASLYTAAIKNYAWDQSDKFVKIYITLEGVEKLSKEKITSKFTNDSMEVVVHELDGKNHQLRITKLCRGILGGESYVKVKNGSLLVMMKKGQEKENWEDVCPKVKSPKDALSSGIEDKAKDPQESIMEMMKKMYDEGDDDMKRTLNKAWSESRGKTGPTMDI